jgi:hypothetical protein
MNHSNNINELAAALAKAQGCMAPAKMDSVNPFLKNRYADLGSVIQAARQPLSANGLSFTQHPAVTESQVSVTTLLLHASGEWIESEITLPLDGGKGLSLAQSMGAIITYLRRYSLASILGIYADEDTDGNESKKAAPAQKATVPAPAPTSTQAQATATQVTPVTKDALKDAWPPSAPVSYDMAATVTSQPSGKRYLDMTVKELNGRLIHFQDVLAKASVNPDSLPQAERDAAQLKIDVAKTILAIINPQ